MRDGTISLANKINPHAAPQKSTQYGVKLGDIMTQNVRGHVSYTGNLEVAKQRYPTFFNCFDQTWIVLKIIL